MSARRHRTGKSAAIFLALAVAAVGGGAWAQPGQPPAPVPIPAPAPAQAPAPAGELPLSGPAFTLADEAYRAMERRDYRTAVAKAEEAIRQRPDVPRLKRLVVAALEASGNPLEAERRAAEFVAAGDSDPGLLADRDRLRRNLRGSALARAQMDVLKDPNDPAARRRLAQILAAPSAPAAPNPAYVAAEAAYKALARQDYELAAARAADAVRLQPSNKDYRRLLVNALAGAGRLSEADAAATEALARDPADWALLAERGAVRWRQNRPADAADDYEAALKLGVPESRVRGIRLALADAAAKAGQPQRVLDALAPYADERSYAVASRRGFAQLALGKNEDALASFDAAVATAEPGRERDVVTAAKIGVLADLDQRRAAADLFAQSLANNGLGTLPDLDVAYLGVRVRNDEVAGERFAKARADGTLTPAAALDAAYASKRLAENKEALAYFQTAIDAAADGTLRLPPQKLFDVRREYAEVERRWGAYSTLTYNAIGVAPSTPLAPPPPQGNVLQAGFEAYWRPPVIGYRNGRIVELFVRSFETLADGSGGPTGISTTQGMAGARWKPLSDINLVLEGAKLFALGTYGRNDWMLRAAASQSQGTDLRVEEPNWTMWQVYGEYARFFVTPQNLMSFEGRLGRSFRADAVSDHLVATPFLVLGGAYDDTLATPGALGAGGGLGLRYWFREDKYAAPRSYVDMNVQYRFKLAGDDRAQGVFAGLTVGY
jgi:tetratricopeptide (TPR) repeat protein